jgi:hypothetical protein
MLFKQGGNYTMKFLPLLVLFIPLGAYANTPRQIAEFLLDNEPAMVQENCLYMRRINASGYSVYSSSFRREAIAKMTQRGMSYSEAEKFNNAMVIAVSRMCPDVR